MSTNIHDYQQVRNALLLTGDKRTPTACAFDLGLYWTSAMQRQWSAETLFCRTHGWVYPDFKTHCFACLSSESERTGKAAPAWVTASPAPPRLIAL